MKYLAALFAFSALASPALADGRAVIQSPTPEGMSNLEVSWTGDGQARFDPEQAAAYMLTRDNSLYAVTNAGGMGATVMELSALCDMAGPAAMGGADSMPAGITIERAEDVVAVEATGRTETLAGMEGELYEITWIDSNEQEHTDNAVLSDAPLALEIAEAFEMLAANTCEGEVDPRQNAVRARGLAILRYADSYTVISASDEGRPAGAFELPAEPTDLSAMMQGMGPNN